MAATLLPARHLRATTSCSRLRVVEAPPRHPLVQLLGTRPVLMVAGLALALVLLVGGALAVGRGGLASLAPAPPAATATASSASDHTVVVEAGDTLWSIARRLQPTGDVRPLVDQLMATHGSATLQPGERLLIGS